MSRVAIRLAGKMMDAGSTTIRDCSSVTLDRIDLPSLGRELAAVIRCHGAGRIDDEQVLLFVRAHWALAALRASFDKGTTA
jgi:hypothetical protein